MHTQQYEYSITTANGVPEATYPMISHPVARLHLYDGATFVAAPGASFGTAVAAAAAFLDYDGDGSVDLLLGGDASLTAYQGDGTGALAARPVSALGFAPPTGHSGTFQVT